MQVVVNCFKTMCTIPEKLTGGITIRHLELCWFWWRMTVLQERACGHIASGFQKGRSCVIWW